MNSKILVIILKAIPETIENLNLVRENVISKALPHVVTNLPEDDTNEILKLCNYNSKIKRVLSGGQWSTYPFISIGVLIELLQSLPTDNYHYDEVRTSILNAIIKYVSRRTTYSNIVKILKTYENDNGKLDILDLLIKTAYSASDNGALINGPINDHVNDIVAAMNTIDSKEIATNIIKKYIEDINYVYLFNTIKNLEDSKQFNEDSLVDQTILLIENLSEITPKTFIKFFENIANWWSIHNQIKIMNTMILKIGEFTCTDYLCILKLFAWRSNGNLLKIIDIITTKKNEICANEFLVIVTYFKSVLDSKDLRKLIKKVSVKINIIDFDNFMALTNLIVNYIRIHDLAKTIKLLLTKTQKLSLKQCEEFMDIFEHRNADKFYVGAVIQSYISEQSEDKLDGESEKRKS